MVTLKEAFDNLLASGIFNYKSDLLKKNCSKCYDRRHIGKYLNCYEMVESSGVIAKVPVNSHYIPCKCLISKMPELEKIEKKKSVVAIGDENFKNIENVND